MKPYASREMAGFVITYFHHNRHLHKTISLFFYSVRFQGFFLSCQRSKTSCMCLWNVSI